MTRTGITEKVREILRGQRGEFTWQDVARGLTEASCAAQGIKLRNITLPMGTVPALERVRQNIFKGLIKGGEVVSVRRGVYVYREKRRPQTARDKIWHLVRSHKIFDTDVIERLSGVARAKVREYLCGLCDLGYLWEKAPEAWQIVEDPGPATPRIPAREERN